MTNDLSVMNQAHCRFFTKALAPMYIVFSCVDFFTAIHNTDSYWDESSDLNSSNRCWPRKWINVLDDWNGPVGHSGVGCKGIHGGHGWGTRIVEGERLLEFDVSCGLVIGYTCLISDAITWSSIRADQVPTLLIRKRWVVHLKVPLYWTLP